MRWRGIWRSALVMTLSMAMIVLLFLAGLVGFTVLAWSLKSDNNFSTNDIDAALTQTADGYHFSGDTLVREGDLWAMLIADDGRVVWSVNKPADVPTTYNLRDVASFTRWYLADYPVRTRIRDDGLLVIGAPKNSMQRYSLELSTRALWPSFFWFCGLFLVMLAAVLAISSLLLRRWFHHDQAQVDAARSEWVNGVSHDIRTPLSLVMGSAATLEADKTLPADARQEATLIRRQSQHIRDLVGDLNLTMRLDTSMQTLRLEDVQPQALLRQCVADFLNSGMADGYPLDIDLPAEPLPPIRADAQLLRRALANLLNNAVRHNPPGCAIRAGGFEHAKGVVLYVESDAPASASGIGQSPGVTTDGLAAHGTGLTLVAKIAQAHGGYATFSDGACFRCELWLPRKLLK